MSVRLTQIMQPLMDRPIPGNNNPFAIAIESFTTGIRSVHEGAPGTTIAQRGEALETQRIVRQTFEQMQAITPIIGQIIDTTKRYADEQARDVKGTRAIFNGVTVLALGVFGYVAGCPLMSAKCASMLVEKNIITDESAIVPTALLMATAGVVTAASLQVIKNAFFADHRAEDQAKLTRLWTELDGVVPANLITAGNSLKNEFVSYGVISGVAAARTAPQGGY